MTKRKASKIDYVIVGYAAITLLTFISLAVAKHFMY